MRAGQAAETRRGRLTNDELTCSLSLCALQQPLRERLLNTLGNRYTSVEEWRLEQDAKKAAHWKRWGPYLSERQWVRALTSSPLLLLLPCTRRED